MQRYFNTEGQCEPEDHYMVRLDERLEEIKTRYVDSGKYFVINRGRQYGKTTTLRALARYLKDRYIVIDMDFQLMSAANFANEQMFCAKFIEYMKDLLSRKEALETVIDLDSLNALLSLKNLETISLDMLFDRISRMCEKSKKPFVLMIDEVDSASNNEVFIEFLAQLRGYYLNRKNRATFQSVILAGIYDIKNLKLKIRPDEAHQYNSPWNIAADFKIEMSFSVEQIRAMLEEYEAEHHTGMDLTAVAQDIYGYTSGYPYLVSAICKDLDEEITDAWTREGIIEAVKLLLNKNIPLFGSMVRHISEYPDLKNMLHAMLFLGEQVAYNPDNKMIDLACMFGYTVNDHGSVLEKFVEYFTEIYSSNDEKFVEAYGRKFFLLYLKPIINGVGNYYIEAQTRDAKRTDVIVDYAGEQFIVELKIWYGDEYNRRGEQQLAAYLDYFRQNKGYLLSYNFNKKKETGVKVLTLGDKTIVEAVV